MGATQSKNMYVTYCTIQQAIKLGKTIIHIMNIGDETILIKGTLTAEQEVQRINTWINDIEHTANNDIFIYGYSDSDFNKLLQRQKQLNGLGFKRVYIYLGGMFEWLLLRDVYSADEFPVDGLIKGAALDILRYNKPVAAIEN